ncbi:Hypothetical Protein FCC1311_090452 [Hondaea fermentalgiana]|uniref:Homologous recombination OB-fold protein OB-fold domain-containing protein n=1 Tax=Hondaea fermentalgiana TaxID=2315210 RepID=A0A2R5GPN3_9STRA|nr:Hypothetical Protein FCC1311_090452 [Hondaea fermentalgiana]|eukprot:GBG32820.1 Hypothetical Protein FCC1311_090452 [Hondaea fermentalgiana]
MADPEEAARAASQAESVFSYGNLSFSSSQPQAERSRKRAARRESNHREHNGDHARRNRSERDGGQAPRDAEDGGPGSGAGDGRERQTREAKASEGEEEPRKGRKVRKSHVFWAARANAAISSDFCLKLSSQEVQSMGQTAKLGLRQDFRPPRQAPVAASRFDVRADDAAQLQGTIFEQPAPRAAKRPDHANDDAFGETSRLVQSTLSFATAPKRSRTSKCFDVAPVDEDEAALSGTEPERSADGLAAEAEARQRRNPFESAPWRMVQRRFPSALEEYSVRAILENRLGNARKVPSLAVIVLKTHYLEEGATCVLADPTGEIESEVHPQVLSSDQYDFVEGCAVVLKDFTVFRAHLNREGYASHSVIITPRNIERLFGANEMTDTQDQAHVDIEDKQPADAEDDSDLVGWLSGNAAEDEATKQSDEVHHQEDTESSLRLKQFEAFLSSQASSSSREQEQEQKQKQKQKQKEKQTQHQGEKTPATPDVGKETKAMDRGKTLMSTKIDPATTEDASPRMEQMETIHDSQMSASVKERKTQGREPEKPPKPTVEGNTTTVTIHQQDTLVSSSSSRDDIIPAGTASSRMKQLEVMLTSPCEGAKQNASQSSDPDCAFAFASQAATVAVADPATSTTAATPAIASTQASSFNDDRWLDDDADADEDLFA